MDETNEKIEQSLKKYLILMRMICITENRLNRSERVEIDFWQRDGGQERISRICLLQVGNLLC